jgi:two-component system OmpR family sensor kinase/two-component system sensor histidine kinase BaeS
VWRHRRKRFFWRFGVIAALLLAFTFSGISLLAWFIARMVGVVPASGALVVLTMLGLGIIALVGLVVAGRAMRRIASPIGYFMEAAGQLAEGNYEVRVAERGPPELQALAHAFNQMAIRLQTHENQRRNLLADVAHELRTPLAVIQGNLEGLLDGVYPRDDAHLTLIFEEARLAAGLIEDLRTLALAETGTLSLHREPTDLGAIISETTSVFQSDTATTGVKLSVAPVHDLPMLNLDPARIRQVLTNLVVNALHHTPQGGSIEIASVLDSDPKTPRVVLTVTDTGSGIAPEDLPRIFDRFYKTKDSRGSGLGLAIAKNLILMHGGTITARSAVGKGTTVEINLPVEQID